MNALKRHSPAFSPIAAEVYEGLTSSPKWLSPHLFYDATGSELFERITTLPEYYPTRIERDLFAKHADEMIAAAGKGLTLIELGAGTAKKTQVLLRALMMQQMSATFYPVDVSRSALEIARKDLNEKFLSLKVRPLLGDYSEGLPQLASIKGKKLVLYIGSSIGNFEPGEASAVLLRLRSDMQEGDALLLGVDTAPSESKTVRDVVQAYNDSRGVTAEFNKNVLHRINRELGGDFALDTFEHIAQWNAEQSRIEMHLESRKDQSVYIRDLELTLHFRRGESIHTENSYKYTEPKLRELLQSSGFKLERSWYDDKRWFGVHLARV
jgi:dimethylhistidine N-methyltransferase